MTGSGLAVGVDVGLVDEFGVGEADEFGVGAGDGALAAGAAALAEPR